VATYDSSINGAGGSESSGSGFGGALDSLFSALPQLTTSIATAVNGPPRPGQLVYNPATHTYQPAGAMTSVQQAGFGSTLGNPLVLIAIAIAIVLLIRK
jgi:hypothetical protein